MIGRVTTLVSFVEMSLAMKCTKNIWLETNWRNPPESKHLKILVLHRDEAFSAHMKCLR